jgi:acyl-CoA reductase-like NAD-dependent aldehyde dehydrogenase
MSSNAIQITGTAMAVLIGVVLIISPWMIPIALGYKLLMILLGIGLCWLGIQFSKG